ncbi:IS5 family transposase [Nonomuraea pusilla]|uniref:IS5 family transposase n=1 Tax=Nonomuraea pusilla TaxID=46177 RepID=UPI003B5AF6F1
MKRHDLTDEEWERLAPLLPVNPRQGGRWADHRTVINGVFLRTRTNITWRDLPSCYGNWKTVYNRHRRWSMDGTWLHQHAAGARQARRRPTSGKGGAVDHKPVKGREALGRSRGGFSTKIHLVADRRCRPIATLISPGQHGDSPYFRRVLERVRIAPRGLGRPRTRPGRVLADKAYSSRGNRAYLRRRGIKAVIPIKKDQRANRLRQGRRGGRPPGFDAEWYKERNTAERCVNKLKDYRAVALRTDKRERIYQGTIDVASIRIWLRYPVS